MQKTCGGSNFFSHFHCGLSGPALHHLFFMLHGASNWIPALRSPPLDDVSHLHCIQDDQVKTDITCCPLVYNHPMTAL